jgi:DNA polymerase III delta prime subunit
MAEYINSELYSEKTLSALALKIENMDSCDKKIFNDCSRLIYELREFDKLIGLNDIKEQLYNSLQTYIIKSLNGDRTESEMFHLGFYGPPGTGKTECAGNFARILISAGFVKQVDNSSWSQKIYPSISNPANLEILFIIFVLLGYIGSYIVGIWNILGTKWLLLFTIIIVVIIAILYSLYQRDRKTPTGQEEIKEFIPELRNDLIIARRSDLVAEYVGHTAIKTTKVLQSALGKVLFIDEAYQLITDDRDSFGIECLNTINQFMSEHPGEITIIFAGYEKQMKNFFKQQPGFFRRIKKSFKFTGYTSTELFQIFEYKTKKNGFSLYENDYSKIRKLIIDNHQYFPGFAGDIGKLFEECNNMYTERIINQSGFCRETISKLSTKTFTYEMVKDALIIVKNDVNNRLVVDDDEEDPWNNSQYNLRQFLSKFNSKTDTL